MRFRTMGELRNSLKKELRYWENRVAKNPDRKHKAQLNLRLKIRQWLEQSN